MKELYKIIFFFPCIVFAQSDPVASNVSAATVENSNATIHLVASDADFDALTYAIVSSPTNGSLGTVVGSTVTYTPTNNYTGFDSFTFKANDGNSDSATRTVSIKVFEGYKTTQVQLGDDIDGEAAGDILSRTSFNEDGTIMAVGAKWNDDNGTNSGHVRVYQLSGCSWIQLGGDIDGEAANDFSGEDISLSSDGTIVAIGSPRHVGAAGYGVGHVRVYQFSNGSWTQLGDDIDGEAANDLFGFSVSLSSDGLIVAIGAYILNEGDSGYVRVYQFSNGTWTQLGVDIDGEVAGDEFGTHVSLSSDGAKVAIGAPKNDGNGTNSGHVRVYQFSGGSWIQLGVDIDGEAAGDFYGGSVSLSSDGLIVAIGASTGNESDSGYVRVYQFSNGTWTQLGVDIDGEFAGDQFGTHVSLSSDGAKVAIGAPKNDGNGTSSGHVRVYQFSGGTWTQLGDDIDGEATEDLSGWNVSLSSDGTTAAIGAFANDGNGTISGHVRVYKLVNFYNQWQGGQSTSWGTANNWSFGTEPIECDDIKIPSGLTNYPIISVGADKVINSITLDSGSSLILSKNSSLSITDSFTNNGTVTLNSDSDEFSSLLVGGSTTSGSGNVTYNRYVNIIGTGEWDLIGPPVSGMAFSSLIDDPNIANNGSSVYAVGSYNNLTDTWTNATAATMGNLTLGQGYQMATTDGGTLSFIGAIANGDQSVIITNNDAANSGAGMRWNLIANPFASYLNANSNADASNNFLTVNAASLETFYQAIYGWKADGTGYAIYNNTTAATYIAPGQGFFVAAAGSGADQTITFTKAMQTVTGADDFADDFVASRPSVTSYELVLDMYSDAIKVADTKFYFKEGLTLGLDPGYDAAAYNQSSGLSSRLLEQDSGIAMSINAMSIDDMSNVIVPLAVNQEAGISLKIQIANSTIPEDINVYLEDAVENTFTLLTNESFELLAQTTLSGVGRFFLHYTTSTLSTDTVSNTSLLTVYKGKGNTYITVEGLQQFSQPAELTLYNVLGMKILSRNIQNPSQKEMLSTVGMRTGVYILKVQAENIVFTKKLVIE
jgi:hypothetical protein